MLKRKREYAQALFCLILLFATPVAITWPTLVRGDAPVNLEALTLLAPWQEARTADTDVQSAVGSDEFVERYYPWYSFLNQAAKYKELPLWNPLEGFGVPFLSLWRTRVFSLFSLPFYFLPLPGAIGVSVFMKLAIAGLCAYFVARRFQFTPIFSLLVAVPVQFSGVFLAAHWLPVSDVAPFFPLLLPCLQRLLLGDRRGWPYLALLIGIMTLGGDPESLAAILFFMVVLVIIYGLRTYQRDRIRSALFWLVLGSAVGVALAGVQLAPYVEFLRYGNLENKDSGFFTLWDLEALFAPPILANGDFPTQRAVLWLPAAMVGFLLSPLWITLRPFANRIRKRRIEAFLLAALLLLPLAALLGAWVRRIPGLDLLDASHFMIPFPLAFGLLAATTADEWVHLDAQKCKIVLAKLMWLLPLMWALFAGATGVLLWFHPMAGFSVQLLLPCAIAALCILFVVGFTLLWPRPTFSALSLSLITAALLWYVYQPHARITPASRVAPQTQCIQALSDEDTRVAGSEQIKQWPLSASGIAQVYSSSGARLHRGEAFLDQTKANPELFRLTAASRLLLTKEDIKEQFASLRPMLSIQAVLPSGAILLKDLQTMPRSRVVYTARKVEDGSSPAPLRAAGPPLIEGGNLPATGTDAPSTAAGMRRTGFNTLEVLTEGDLPGILVLADSWYPGWKAYLDGAPTPIFPVDIAFRGVEVGAGRHQVIFEYKPESLRLGLYITAGAMIVVLLGMRNAFRTHRARKIS